jgi:hypothetical protein
MGAPIAQSQDWSLLVQYQNTTRDDYFLTATSQGTQAARASDYHYRSIEGALFTTPQPGTVPLKLFWHAGRADNFTTATAAGEQSALAAGYQFAWIEGYVFASAQLGTVPLKLFWHASRGDNFTTATAAGEQSALAAGYQFARIEGYVVPIAELALYWHSERGDNFTTATVTGEQSAQMAGYTFTRIEGDVFSTPQPGTAPLKLFWHAGRADNFTTATAVGEQSALAAGYVLVRTEGYVFTAAQPGTVPLKLFWHAGRGDNFTTATAAGEQSALAAGYVLVRVEGFVFPDPAFLADELWDTFVYEANFPHNRNNCWSLEAQGIAHDEDHWYVADRYHLRRYHRSQSLSECQVTHTFSIVEYSPWFPSLPTFPHNGCNHIGDIVYYQGLVYAPLEGCNGTPLNGQNQIFVLDPTLQLVKTGVLGQQTHASWVAINPADGFLYSSDYQTNQLKVYSRSFGNGAKLTPVRTVQLPLWLDQIQGGEFSASGHLYLTVGFEDDPAKAGIYVFQIVSDTAIFRRHIHPNGYQPGGDLGDLNPGDDHYEEIEGITIWDVDGLNIPGADGQPMRGQIHWILLDNDYWGDEVYLKHISVDNPDAL